jgi:hypothetical protein
VTERLREVRLADAGSAEGNYEPDLGPDRHAGTWLHPKPRVWMPATLLLLLSTVLAGAIGAHR